MEGNHLRTSEAETALAVGVMHPRQRRFDADESFEELKSLLTTAGARLAAEEFAEVRNFHPATFLGQGKVAELGPRIRDSRADVVVVDAELSPGQGRNLEEAWRTRVMDRTGLILDIFAQQARSKEGKLQVELAQYRYLLPRLVRAWTHLSKQRGGAIGLRGPGETQLEVDRRRARERIVQIKKELAKVSRSRQIHRRRRQAVPVPTVSLIGYTNAGKSTLFNALVKGDAISDDKLFSTLDPKTRRMRLPSGQPVLLSDTVGFIRNLPHQLVESFKSTFEEVAGSDLLIHVIDASHPNRGQCVRVVEGVLKDLGLQDIPMLKVVNKTDRLDGEALEELSAWLNGSNIKTSALKGEGLDDLLSNLEERLSREYYRTMNLFIPYADGKALSELYSHGRVRTLTSSGAGYKVEASLPPKWFNIFKPYECRAELPHTATDLFLPCNNEGFAGVL